MHRHLPQDLLLDNYGSENAMFPFITWPFTYLLYSYWNHWLRSRLHVQLLEVGQLVPTQYFVAASKRASGIVSPMFNQRTSLVCRLDGGNCAVMPRISNFMPYRQCKPSLLLRYSYAFEINADVNLTGGDAVYSYTSSWNFLNVQSFFQKRFWHGSPFRTATPALTTPKAAWELIV